MTVYNDIFNKAQNKIKEKFFNFNPDEHAKKDEFKKSFPLSIHPFLIINPHLKDNLVIDDWLEAYYTYCRLGYTECEINLNTIKDVFEYYDVKIDFENLQKIYLKNKEKYKQHFEEKEQEQKEPEQSIRQQENEEPEQQEEEQLKILAKSIIEKFVSQFIDENNYPEEFTLKENVIKSLALILKDDNDIEIHLDLLNELVCKSIKAQNLAVFKNLFYKANPDIINNKNLLTWIQAYINTFENNLNYKYYFGLLLIQNDIDLENNIDLDYFISESDNFSIIYKIYRKENESWLKKKFDEEFDLGNDKEFETELLIEKIVSNIITKQHKSWFVYYLEYYLNIEIEKRHLRALANIYKNNMQSGEKLVKHNDLTIDVVDKMSGIEFEYFLSDLFSKSGYNAEVTKGSGDQGADLIIEKFGERTVVQAKRYSGAVSNTAIQEVVAAKAHYNCSRAMVITNSYFTKSAMELANSNNVELLDREKLEVKIEVKIEEFNLNTVRKG